MHQRHYVEDGHGPGPGYGSPPKKKCSNGCVITIVIASLVAIAATILLIWHFSKDNKKDVEGPGSDQRSNLPFTPPRPVPSHEAPGPVLPGNPVPPQPVPGQGSLPPSGIPVPDDNNDQQPKFAEGSIVRCTLARSGNRVYKAGQTNYQGLVTLLSLNNQRSDFNNGRVHEGFLRATTIPTFANGSYVLHEGRRYKVGRTYLQTRIEILPESGQRQWVYVDTVQPAQAPSAAFEPGEWVYRTGSNHSQQDEWEVRSVRTHNGRFRYTLAQEGPNRAETYAHVQQNEISKVPDLRQGARCHFRNSADVRLMRITRASLDSQNIQLRRLSPIGNFYGPIVNSQKNKVCSTQAHLFYMARTGRSQSNQNAASDRELRTFLETGTAPDLNLQKLRGMDARQQNCQWSTYSTTQKNEARNFYRSLRRWVMAVTLLMGNQFRNFDDGYNQRAEPDSPAAIGNMERTNHLCRASQEANNMKASMDRILRSQQGMFNFNGPSDDQITARKRALLTNLVNIGINSTRMWDFDTHRVTLNDFGATPDHLFPESNADDMGLGKCAICQCEIIENGDDQDMNIHQTYAVRPRCRDRQTRTSNAYHTRHLFHPWCLHELRSTNSRKCPACNCNFTHIGQTRRRLMPSKARITITDRAPCDRPQKQETSSPEEATLKTVQYILEKFLSTDKAEEDSGDL